MSDLRELYQEVIFDHYKKPRNCHVLECANHQADGYNPQAANATAPSPASPFTLSLLDNIRRLKLDVQRIVPVHYPADNRVVTMAELTRWVGRTGTN